jgi:hypothetical protein
MSAAPEGDGGSLGETISDSGDIIGGKLTYGTHGSEVAMHVGSVRVGSIVIVVWLIIGALAAGQRGYYGNSSASCSTVGTTLLTIVAGPLNYLGVNPKTSCETPQPSK